MQTRGLQYHMLKAVGVKEVRKNRLLIKDFKDTDSLKGSRIKIPYFYFWNADRAYGHRAQGVDELGEDDPSVGSKKFLAPLWCQRCYTPGISKMEYLSMRNAFPLSSVSSVLEEMKIILSL